MTASNASSTSRSEGPAGPREDALRARVQTRLDRVELGNFGDHRGVGMGVFELRIDRGRGYRVYYGRDGEDLVVLLTRGTRKRQAHDIETAHTLWMAYGQEKRHARQRTHEAGEYLRAPEDVAAYLNAAIEESDGDPRLLMQAFRNVAAAQGGVSAIARRADVDRVALSRGLSGNRDPRLGTVTKIAAVCGVALRFVQRGTTD